MTKRRLTPFSGGNRKNFSEMQLRSHYGLAKRRANAYNKNPKKNTRLEIEGIMQSAKKHLRAVNAERIKHYKKPLTLEELIEIIRESE